MKDIFVGNLDYNIAEDSVQELFAQYGAVERVSIVRDRDTGQPRGFGFVEMTDDQAADRAILELNGALLGNRSINVNEARPKAAGGGRSGGFKRSGGGRQGRPPRW